MAPPIVKGTLLGKITEALLRTRGGGAKNKHNKAAFYFFLSDASLILEQKNHLLDDGRQR